MSKKHPISDHALLRYIKRVLKIDTEKLRAMLMQKGLKAAIAGKASRCTIEGVEFVISPEGRVVTAYEKIRQ